MSKILNLGKASEQTKDKVVGSFDFDGSIDPTSGQRFKEDAVPDTTCYTNDPASGLEVAVSTTIY